MRRRAIPLVLVALSFAVAVAQRPGELVADTKVNLYLDPWRFLKDVLSAWSPTSDLGHVWAGQYGGYLFPMAPFFALGHALGLPMWLVQRLWVGALLALAAWGMVRLLDALHSRERGVAHLAAGALFVVNPYVAVYVDRTSIALLAYAALPWLLLAVHRGLREPRGWRWPALFALVLTSTGGGVNVAVTGWVLLGPLALALYESIWARPLRPPGAGRGAPWSFAWRLGVATVAASLWWLVPVVVHSSYGLDFLPFTEQPGTIWSTTSVSESLRLMGFWTSYIGVGFGGRLYPFAGHGEVLLFDRPVVVAGLLVPALALASFLWSRRLRYGPFLLGLTLLGVLVMAAGWPDGTPLRRGLTFTYNHVEALRFLRTTYKAGPLTALGLAGLGGLGFAALWARLRAPAARWGAAAVAVALVGVASWPLTSGRAIERQLAFDVPSAWRQVAAELDARGQGSRALEEPGQLFAFSAWGGTIDDVLPALTSHPVATRYIVPFADLRSVDLQWSVDDLIGQRRALPGQLAPLLDLMGVGDVVVAADRDRQRGGGPGTLETLDALRGLPITSRTGYGASLVVQPEAGRVASARREPRVQRLTLPTGGLVRVLPRAPLTVVDGSAQGLGELAAFGALDPSRPIAYAADLGRDELRAAASSGATVVMTDSNRRQAFVASRLKGNRGSVLAAGEHVSQDGTMLDPFSAGPDAQTVAVLRGLASATMPFSPQVTQFPEHRPYAALDGDTSTAWLADPALAPDRRRLDLTFDAPRDVPYVDLMPYSDVRGRVRAVTVDGRRFAVHDGWNRLRLGLRHASGLRIAIGSVMHPRTGSFGAGGIRELRIPGVRVHEALRGPIVAQDALHGADLRRTTLVYQLSRVTADDPANRGRLAGPAQERLVRDARDPEPQLDRLLSPPAARTWTVRAWTSVGLETPDDALDRLAGTTGAGAAWSSSRFEGRPGNRASGALDGDARTAWLGQWIPGRPAWLAWETGSQTTVRALRLRPVAERVRRATVVRVLAAPSRAALARVPA
ncbi:MAG TPA: alpha-(1-_3)-arabinofuranosyltransferase family protein, partial [Solirubrobacteraceae bacterium]|nr:alpha-(1->3)-arabinofuranosyltransferase family protein [Solirubrobacteraceae bacterium]